MGTERIYLTLSTLDGQIVEEATIPTEWLQRTVEDGIQTWVRFGDYDGFQLRITRGDSE